MNFNLKLTIGCSFFILLLGSQVSAQENEGGHAYTLEELISYALENSINIENSAIDEQIAKARVGELRANGLPQITGSVQLIHNQRLRKFFLDTSSPFATSIPGVSELPPGTVISQDNIFQLPSSGDAGITISQLIFDGSYFVGLQAARTYKELASKTTSQTRIQAVEQVTKAYYTVLINRERLALFQENIARVDSLLRDTKGLYTNGFAENIDVARVQVAMNNLLIEKEKFNNLLELSLELLKFQINYPMSERLLVAGDVKELAIDNIIDPFESEIDYSNRIEFSILQTQEALQKLDVKNNRVGYFPSLSAFANLGYFTQSSDIKGLFSTQTEELPENLSVGPDKWYRYGLIGVTLNVPIFDGLTKSYKIQQSKLNLKKVENGFRSLRSSLDLQVNQAKIALKNGISTLEAQEENVELAEEVARVTKIKYTAGVGSNFEVTEAETALREAQTNYYNALYDVLIAQVDLQTALGILIK